MRRTTTLLLCALFPLGCSQPSPVAIVPATDHVVNPALSQPVDVVRDAQGIPHIYATSIEDASFVEGYLMGEDRLVEADLARHNAEGTLAEIGGDLSASLIDTDILMRMHHMKKTAQDEFDQLKASSDPDAQLLVRSLGKFAAGMNAYIADLQSGRYTLPGALLFAYDPSTIAPWTEVDTLAIGRLLTFQLSYDADSDIMRSTIDTLSTMDFDNASDPARAQRRGFARDLQIIEPFDPTYTLPGDFSTVMPLASASLPRATNLDGALALLQADRPSVRGFGNDHWLHPDNGSNNWVIGPSLSATGHVLVANDPHLDLKNPPTFWLVHLKVSGSQPLDVMGAQFPGAPGVILGMNEHLAWGATVSNLDVTDVYQETVVTCPGSQNPCVMFKGAPVPLQPRQETIKVGRFGTIDRSVTVTLYDVPHHGPILPRVKADHSGVEPLGSSELSVRWTGYDPSQELLAVLGIDRAKSVKEAETAIEKNFRVGGQNWVLGDDQGHFGWTQAQRLPRRPAGTVPWKVLPGDGSAEWLSDLDLRWVPHAFDPQAGFLATANADPVGATDDGDPFASEPMVDGIPLYIGAGFDAGTRVGRITKRLKALIAQKGKLTLDDLQAVQADDESEWDEALAPTFLDAANALAEEIATPGSHPDLTSLVATADMPSKTIVPMVRDAVAKWDFTTGADSVAATYFNVWVVRLYDLALADEVEVLGVQPDDQQVEKLMVRMCNAPAKLATGLSQMTGDSILFDDLNTPEIESKRQMAAKAILDMIDYLIPALDANAGDWTWGRLHTLTLKGLLPLDALQIPLATDPMFPNGFPRHGDNGTVDVGNHGLAIDDFSYSAGPVIRAVYELAPSQPKARNALPGGEVLDPNSPHYRDLMELWRQNQTFDEAFTDADVLASVKKEYQTNGDGRVRFQPR